MSRKQDLKVLSIEKITASSVVINLEKMTGYDYQSGQYITFELNIDGEQINRSYSFSSSPHEDVWQVGVKHVLNGKASTFLNKSLAVGDSITSLEPMGNFLLPETNPSETHYQFFAAGSGITPIYSMLKTLLRNGNAAKISLFYGNKSPEETMFLDELNTLNSANPNFNLELIYSKSGGLDALHSGRMNFGKTLELLRLHASNELDSHAFMCGPGDMINSVKNALQDSGFNDDTIHVEFFTAPVSASPELTPDNTEEITDFSGTAKVKVILDDEETMIEAGSEGPVLLDAALDSGLDAPFSCRGGVCTACRAKVIKGKVHMTSNFALTDSEVKEGFILTCQAHPRTPELEVSYDE